jgi:hypothetical protein
MKATENCSRRQFIGAALAGTALRAMAAENKLAFVVTGKEFTFDTGALRGTFRGGGQSKGLLPAFDCASGAPLTKSLGLFSHYRMFEENKRFGKAAWDWASEAKLLGNGAVEVRWTADEVHPFDMMAVYRWSAANALDLTTRVTARKELKRFEVFLASYFEGFPTTLVYAGNKPGFISASPDAGKWHMFPRDEAAVKMIQDGRWKYPPSPVEWGIRPKLAAPLAIRRDAERKLAAILMTRPGDAYAIACPQDEEAHRSLYFALFGRDLKNGESVEAKSRLMICGEVTGEKALELFAAFTK